MATNGPAIWGGCVTRRKHRAGSRYFSQKVVTVQACLTAARLADGHSDRQGGRKAKSVTSNLPLLSVLAFIDLFLARRSPDVYLFNFNIAMSI